MNILGLHFGHDASITVIRNGRIIAHVLAERFTRQKHSAGLRQSDLDRALTASGLAPNEIDYCAIVSTQDFELMTGLVDRLEIRFGSTGRHPADSPLEQFLPPGSAALEQRLARGLGRMLSAPEGEVPQALLAHWKRLFPEWRELAAGRLASTGWLDAYLTRDEWHQQRPLVSLGGLPFGPEQLSDTLRLGMHYPVTVDLAGDRIPGYFVDHHVAHAASTFYRSGFERAAVITADGGDARRNLSGYFAYGEGHRLYVATPHNLVIGGLYEGTATHLGFPMLGAEGKMMGLSSYGRPRFFDSRFVGNCFDIHKQTGKPPLEAWLEHCLTLARDRGYAMHVGSREHLLGPLSVDIAASTQRLFEETLLEACRQFDAMLRAGGLATPALCLSGGCALNCPGNSRLYMDGPFREIFIEPNCDDGGLSVGAALYLAHNVLEQPVETGAAADNRSPYLGLPVPEAALETVLADAGQRLVVTRPDDVAKAAADDLAADRVVAWFEGRSEAGPRALCHRSLLANPTVADNWARVNRIKGREGWRPFAPAVLEESFADWFSDCPAPAPYMLFTARVRSRRLPAITHVDGTARVQTVAADAGRIHAVLREFEKQTGVPVVMNTSLNGPGEPIVETPAEALAFFERSEADALYLEGWRVSRAAD
ncbi:MAG: carbamoyltransferase C-terminal domain-containing protein [Gammaproteobacteria bacterium]|jgi:carbamoyltransferase